MSFAITAEFDSSHGFDTIEEYLTNLMKEEGFGVLTEVNVKEVMKKKLDLDKQPYKILGFCNPPRANKVLESDGDVGLFLPCNGVIYQRDDKIHVALTNASEMFKMIDNSEIEPVANEVTEIFQKVHSKLVEKFQ